MTFDQIQLNLQLFHVLLFEGGVEPARSQTPNVQPNQSFHSNLTFEVRIPVSDKMNLSVHSGLVQTFHQVVSGSNPGSGTIAMARKTNRCLKKYISLLKSERAVPKPMVMLYGQPVVKK